MNMGQSIAIKGELSGKEDLTLEGQVEGKISLPDNVLTVGTNARINAEVVAKTVIVLGQLVGNVTAKEKFELRAGGSEARAAPHRLLRLPPCSIDRTSKTAEMGGAAEHGRCAR